MKKAYLIVALSFPLKLVLYGLGFYAAIKLSYLHLVSVFVGYLTIKISIYIEGYLLRGGEVNKWK